MFGRKKTPSDAASNYILSNNIFLRHSFYEYFGLDEIKHTQMLELICMHTNYIYV